MAKSKYGWDYMNDALLIVVVDENDDQLAAFPGSTAGAANARKLLKELNK